MLSSADTLNMFGVQEKDDMSSRRVTYRPMCGRCVHTYDLLTPVVALFLHHYGGLVNLPLQFGIKCALIPTVIQRPVL